MDGKINGKAKKNWQAKKHFGWLGPMHCTHHIWFDFGSCFLLRKEEFERDRNVERTSLDENLEKALKEEAKIDRNPYTVEGVMSVATRPSR